MSVSTCYLRLRSLVASLPRRASRSRSRHSIGCRRRHRARSAPAPAPAPRRGRGARAFPRAGRRRRRRPPPAAGRDASLPPLRVADIATRTCGRRRSGGARWAGGGGGRSASPARSASPGPGSAPRCARCRTGRPWARRSPRTRARRRRHPADRAPAPWRRPASSPRLRSSPRSALSFLAARAGAHALALRVAVGVPVRGLVRLGRALRARALRRRVCPCRCPAARPCRWRPSLRVAGSRRPRA